MMQADKREPLLTSVQYTFGIYFKLSLHVAFLHIWVIFHSYKSQYYDRSYTDGRQIGGTVPIQDYNKT